MGCGDYAGRGSGGSRGNRGNRGAGSAIRAVIAILGLVIASAPALAQEDPDGVYSHGRYYLGASGITAFRTGGYKDGVEPSLGVAGVAGYRFHPYFSGDLQGEWHSHFDRHGGGHYQAWALSAIARAYLLKGPTQPYALLGGGVIQTISRGHGSKTTDTGFAPRVGLGIAQYLNRDFALTLDAAYVVPIGSPRDIDFFSINWGFQWY